MSRALTILRGRPGHPLHAVLSDLVVGMFVLATGFHASATSAG